ncbi:MAG: hypothetical protein ACJZ37_03210 [Candidatus Poseidoniales archaeon]
MLMRKVKKFSLLVIVILLISTFIIVNFLPSITLDLSLDGLINHTIYLVQLYSFSQGSFFLFSCLAILVSFKSKNVNLFKKIFPFLSSLILLSSIIFFYPYFRYLAIILVCIIGSIGLSYLLKNYNYTKFPVYTSLLLIFLTSLVALVPHSFTESPDVSESNYDSAMYLNQESLDAIIITDNAGTPVNTLRVYSEILVLPATQPVYLLIPVIGAEFDSKESMVSINLSKIITDPKEMYDFDIKMKYSEEQTLRYFIKSVKNQEWSSVENDFEYLGINRFVHFKAEDESVFYNSFKNEKYVIYENNEIEYYKA